MLPLRTSDGGLRRGAVSAVDRFVRSRFVELTRRHPEVPDAEVERAAIAAFRALWDPEAGRPSPAVQEAVVERFHQLYYSSADRTWRGATTYRGTTIWKCPLDLWLYQELLSELRPGLIVETGTAFGGSARYLGDLCALLGTGQVLTIDTQAFPGRPEHPRVTYVAGSSTSPEAVAEVERRLPPDGSPVLLILDSDHTMAHVREELRVLAPYVTPGSCVIVEDTNVNGHPTYPTFGPGPMEALEDFLRTTDEFSVDPLSEKFFMTFNPCGILRRR